VEELLDTNTKKSTSTDPNNNAEATKEGKKTTGDMKTRERIELPQEETTTDIQAMMNID
jgi:hypothetical protein